jgi:hypothetical protein
MSDHYFKCAREKKCVGLKADMKGFHKCARDNECLKPKINKKPRKRIENAVEPNPEILPRRSERIKAKGSGKTSPWIDHVKSYQSQHGCSYKEALSNASKTYRK